MSRALVVGGGLAGLAAAWRLTAAGVSVRVLGAGLDWAPRVRLGDDEHDADLCTVPLRHPALDALARETGFALRTRRLVRVLEAGSRGPRELALGTFGLLGVGRRAPLRDLWRGPRLASLVRWLAPLLDPDEPERCVRVDDRSAADFARVYLGRRPLVRRLASLLQVHFSLELDATSRAPLLHWLDPGARLALGLLEGLPGLLDTLGARLEVSPASRVVAVQPDGRGAVLEDGARLEADAVVVATPPAETRGLLPLSHLEDEALANAAPAPRLVLALCVSGAVPDAPLWIPRDRGGLLAGVARGESGSLLLIARPALAAAGARDAQAAGDALLRDAEHVLPGLSRRAGERCLWRGARPRFDVYHYRAIERLRREQERLFASRRVAFAGAHLVAPHAEGAARSGLRAAEDVLAALGASLPAPQPAAGANAAT